jgi:hypothetical protein
MPLLLGGALSAAIAALHIVIMLVGAPAYRYFGAGEALARSAESGSLSAPAMTLVVAVVFAIWALYAFGGAGLIRRPPLLRSGLVTIGFICTLRGVAFVPGVLHYLRQSGAEPSRYVVFSFAALVIGLLYLVGTALAWPGLRPSRPDSSDNHR